MLQKAVIRSIVEQQNSRIRDINPSIPREAAAALPYITGKPHLICGMRGSGRTFLLAQLIRNEYPEAWYTDFEDPRLAGFVRNDFRKLLELISESGESILFLDNTDLVEGWQVFLEEAGRNGYKIIAAVSAGSVPETGSADVQGTDSGGFSVSLLKPLSYSEFLAANHKTGSETMVNEYIRYGGIPEYVKNRRPEALLELYSDIMLRDAIMAGKIRDTASFQQLALCLIAASGARVSANSLCDRLKIKAVSTVANNMRRLEALGLIRLLPLYDESPDVRAVNPRKVYAADAAMAVALSPKLSGNPETLLEITVCNHIANQGQKLFYTAEDGGCDFVIVEDGTPVRLVQVCRSSEYEPMQEKITGLRNAMRKTKLNRATIVSLDTNKEYQCDEGLIETVDADTFLGRNESFS